MEEVLEEVFEDDSEVVEEVFEEEVLVEAGQVADGNIKKYKSILILGRVFILYREII